ncbi:hypothetical protein ABPG74_008408 [Tetrahymena malaccensis]
MHAQRNISPSPKCRIYNVDGSGRDTYISFNSGGYIRAHAANYQLTNIKNSNRTPSSCIARVPVQSKYNHYKSDGTGRDSYISYNSGGFVNPQMNFTTKLRDYPEIRQKRSNSFDISYTMRLPSIQDEKRMLQVKEKQRQIRENFNRLAQPKSPSQSPDNTINMCKCSQRNNLNYSFVNNPHTTIDDYSPSKQQNQKTYHLKDLMSKGNQTNGLSGLKQQMLQMSKQNAQLEDELLVHQKQTIKTLPSMSKSYMYDKYLSDMSYNNESQLNQILKTQEF